MLDQLFAILDIAAGVMIPLAIFGIFIVGVNDTVKGSIDGVNAIFLAIFLAVAVVVAAVLT